MCARRSIGGWFWALLLLAGCPLAPVGGGDAGEETPGAPVDGGGHTIDDDDAGPLPSEDDAGPWTRDDGGTLPVEDAGPSTPDDDAGPADAGTHDAGFDDAGTDDAGFDAGPLVCEPHFADCDLDPSNGCETAINTEASCGACGIACAPDNAIGDCSSGSCRISVCEPGFGDCDGDPNNGCETPLNTLSDCGECGRSCGPPGAIGDCSAGICEIDACEPGFDDCDGDVENGCETLLTTTTDCGACGIPCRPSGGEGDCSTGTCEIASCMQGSADCDGNVENGCETNLRTNRDCGGCGVPCSHANGISGCASGSCSLIGCARDYGNCDGLDENGCEQRLDTMAHCGACGNACTFANGFGECANGSCRLIGCDLGWGDCDGDPSNGCEQPLDSLDHCGECDRSCSLANADETCSSGSCEVMSCDALWDNCDGTHSNGCETSLETNANCGACGTPCTLPGANTSCAGGVCSLSSCQAGRSNCDGNPNNGCERRHSAVSGSCSGGTNVGGYGGDTGCGFLWCSSHPEWSNFASHTGRNTAWFRGRVEEKSDCSAPIEHRIRLSVPTGIDYDLYVYRSCGSYVARSIKGTGEDESVVIRQDDNGGRDDSFDYYVEVRYVSGRSCTPFTVYFDGRSC